MARPQRIWTQSLWLLLGSWGMACGSDEPDVRSYDDVGHFCVTSNDDASLTFTVTISAFDRCLSSCRINTSSCSATREGNRIELESRLEIRERSDITECPANCEGSSASCALDGLAAGDYRVGFGGRSDTATLPLAGSISLFEERVCE